MNTMMTRLKENFSAARRDESGDIVQTILIVAIFVIIVTIVGALLFKAIQGRADQTAKCIAGARPSATGGTFNTANC